MGGLDHLDVAARGAVPVAGDHQTSSGPAQCASTAAAMAAAALPRADHHGPAVGGFWQYLGTHSAGEAGCDSCLDISRSSVRWFTMLPKERGPKSQARKL